MGNEMVLYVSGLGSMYKPFIADHLLQRFGRKHHYYILKNKISTDLAFLESICAAEKKVHFIGHSTGGFLGLYLMKKFSNIDSLHLINPAIDLLWSLDRIPAAAPILEERKLIAEIFQDITTNYQDGPYPIFMVQGLLDEIVHVDFNRHFIQPRGHGFYWPTLDHRFDEHQFKMLMDTFQKHFNY
jgi:pimeloyl-ACP methyl ester carboxylesterase